MPAQRARERNDTILHRPPLRPGVSTFSSFHAVLAIECEALEAAVVPVFDKALAERFGAALATDVAKHVEDIHGIDLVCAAAVYDQAEVLRPAWPLHGAMDGFRARLPASAHGVLSIGALDGRMPIAALQPDSRLHGSALRVMPWSLHGDAAAIAAIGARLEGELLDHGMVGAALALVLRDELGIAVQHARHMTLHDLCALNCSQYEHAGLGELWQVIEVGLLSPDREEHIELADGGMLSFRDGRARLRCADRRRHAQFRAILAAHGIGLDAGDA